MAASARDIVPIALSGLAGLLGGPQAAAGIGNAAGTARQMTLDKRDTEDRDKRLAQSARHLELSEEAGKRAEKGLNLTTSRTELLNKQTETQMKEVEKSRTAYKIAKDEYLQYLEESGVDEAWMWLARHAGSHAQLQQAAKVIADREGTMTFEEATQKFKDNPPGPGERLSYRIQDGGTVSATGESVGGGGTARSSYGPVTNEDIDATEREADRDWRRDQSKLISERAKISEKMRNSENGGEVQSDYERQIKDLDEEIALMDTPKSKWHYQYQLLRKDKRLTSDNIKDLKESYMYKFNRPPDPFSPKVLSLYSEIYSQEEPSIAQVGNPVTAREVVADEIPVERSTSSNYPHGR